jgi:hypothetical protein
MFGALSVFGRRMKGVIRLRPEQVRTCNTSPPSAPLAFFTFVMLLAPVTNWEPHGVTLAGYCYAKRHGIKVQTVILIVSVTCNVTALRYEVTLQVCAHLNRFVAGRQVSRLPGERNPPSHKPLTSIRCNL